MQVFKNLRKSKLNKKLSKLKKACLFGISANKINENIK